MASSRSIRFKISALLTVPLVAVTVLWVFATTLTTTDAAELLSAGTRYNSVAKPGESLDIALQREHLLSAEYLSTRTPEARAALTAQRLVVDKARLAMRTSALADNALSVLTPDMKTLLDSVIEKMDALDNTRSAVDTASVDLVSLSLRFAQVPDAQQRLLNSLSSGGASAALSQQGRNVSTASYAREYLTREQALAAGVLAANRRFNQKELRLFGELATTRRYLFTQSVTELPTNLRVPFEGLAASGEYTQFEKMEDKLRDGDPNQLASHDVWLALIDRVQISYQSALRRASDTITAEAGAEGKTTIVWAVITGVLGLLVVIVSVLVSLRVGRRLTRELAALRTAAMELATRRLPRVVERLRRGEDVDVAAEAPELTPVGTTTEVRDVTTAFSTVQHTAVEAAVEQARLREGVAQAVRNLARRSQSLLQRQLKLLDGMQRTAEDPDALENLFKIDHLTTRMRRQAEGLIILSGARPGRTYRNPVPIEDVLRGAVAEIEDYTRVRIQPMREVAVPGGAVADIIHLFAELIENATVFSPPNTQVTVGGELVARGFAVEVEDRGLGLGPDELAAINQRLASPPEFNPADTDRLGLFVVGRLAVRHGLRVQMRPSPFGGTTAIVLLPDSIVIAAEEQPPVEGVVAGLPRRSRRASLSSTEVAGA